MKKYGFIIAICTVMIFVITGVSIYVISSADDNVAVNVNEPVTESTTEKITYGQITVPSTVVINTLPPTTATTTLPATQKTEVSTTSPVATTGFFNVVTTGGTVESDDSLQGLTGESLTLGKVILAAGFKYDPKQQIFYSATKSWQRNFGFTPIYDVGATLGGMYYDTIRLKFTYGDYDYMYQIWKGRYGITTGGEMGIYYKKKGTPDIMYKCADDTEMNVMSFALYRNNEIYMLRGPDRHWWLTGFKIFDVAAPSELTMHCTYFLEKSDLADALEKAVIDYGFIKNVNYQRVQNRITVVWN